MKICPVKGCGGERERDHHAMCPDCWRRTPPPLKDDIMDAYKTGNRLRILRACKAAYKFFRQQPAT